MAQEPPDTAASPPEDEESRELGACEGVDRPWSPVLLAEAEDPEEDEDPEDEDDVIDTGWALDLCEPAADAEWPGADSATSTANPAVSAALVPTTQRRVRLTRASAAFRLSGASGSRPGPALGFCGLLMVAEAISHR